MDGDRGNVYTFIIAACTILAIPYFLVASLIDAAAPLYHRTAILVLIIIGLVGWEAQFINLAFEIFGVWACYYDEFDRRVCFREPTLASKPYYREMAAEAMLRGLVFGFVCAAVGV